jgi:hypothetical protein
MSAAIAPYRGCSEWFRLTGQVMLPAGHAPSAFAYIEASSLPDGRASIM